MCRKGMWAFIFIKGSLPYRKSHTHPTQESRTIHGAIPARNQNTYVTCQSHGNRDRKTAYGSISKQKENESLTSQDKVLAHVHKKTDLLHGSTATQML